MNLHEILQKLKNGEITDVYAETLIRQSAFDDLGYAKLDTQRSLRTGFGEVVFCSGKDDK